MKKLKNSKVSSIITFPSKKPSDTFSDINSNFIENTGFAILCFQRVFDFLIFVFWDIVLKLMKKSKKRWKARFWWSSRSKHFAKYCILSPQGKCKSQSTWFDVCWAEELLREVTSSLLNFNLTKIFSEKNLFLDFFSPGKTIEIQWH